MSAISIDYKYYPFIAIVHGFILGDYIGAVASFLFVKEYLSPRKNKITLQNLYLSLWKFKS